MKSGRALMLSILVLATAVACSQNAPLPAPTSTLPAPVLMPAATHPPTAAPTFSPTAAALGDTVQVTFVGNSGFLITVGDKKILIDALFAGFEGAYALPQDVQEVLVNARPPFDDIDLILATHNHADHFSAGMVRQHLQNDPAAGFVSTAQATSQLAGFENRVVSLAATKGKPDRVTVNGIQVEALYLSHGTVPAGETEIINFGYVVTVNGIKLFHTGDIDASLLTVADLQTYGLPEDQIDLAFVPHFILASPGSPSLIGNGVKSKYVIASHYKYTSQPNPGLIKRYWPGAIVFDTEMQTWVMP